MPMKVIARKVATENQEYRYHEKSGHRHQYCPENYREETELLRSHMQDARRHSLLKQAVFGIMDDKNKRGRPKRRWMDELVDWCNKDICTLHGLAMNRGKRSHFVKYVMDTNGHRAHGTTEREREVNTKYYK